MILLHNLYRTHIFNGAIIVLLTLLGSVSCLPAFAYSSTGIKPSSCLVGINSRKCRRFLNPKSINTSSSRINILYHQSNDEVYNYEASPPSVVPQVVVHPVLRQVYPHLMAHKIEFGNPNIPLGSSAGRMCSTLRRLYLQSKLTEEEVILLQSEGFIFLSFDNIYDEANFDEMLQRLIEYEAIHKNNYQIPKKYPYDVQLGAWVTNLRRLGPDGVAPEHLQQLDQIQFSWTSERKCGSAFMKNLKEVRAALESIRNSSSTDGIIDFNTYLCLDHRKWLVAQRGAHANGNLSEMRLSYIDDLCQDFKLDLSKVTK